MKNIQIPDYSRCCVNLISSIGSFFGVSSQNSGLLEIELTLSLHYRHVVLLLLDGLGSYFLDEHLPKDSFLRRNKLCDLSAVYPSTTVAATTSIKTGLYPAEHGRLGWTMYFPQIQKSVDVFENSLQFTKQQAENYHVCEKYLPTVNIFQKINNIGKAKGYAVSAHDALYAADMNQIASVIKEVCMQPELSYVYAYLNRPDFDIHEYGVYSKEVESIIQTLDIQVENLYDELPDDTLLLITADHGLVDTVPVFVEDNPRLAQMLLRPPVLEPRAAAMYVKPEFYSLFPEEFYNVYGNDFMMLKSEEAIEKGLFGFGKKQENLQQYCGNFLALAIGNKAIYQNRSQTVLKGMHAGLTPLEMNVPLIIGK